MIPTLETDRLILRPLAETDMDEMAAFFQGERSRFVGGPMPRHQVWRALATMLGHWMIRGYGMFGVVEKATGRLAGRVGPWFPDAWPEREIGWTLFDHAEGRGIGFEAAKATRDWAYGSLGWTTAISLVAEDNLRSKKLAERLGATYEAPFQHPDFGAMEIWRHPGPEAA